MASHVDPNEFRETLGRFASGVTIVTMAEGENVHGITVSAFMSVSLEPPLVLISIDRSTRAHAVLARVDRYAVSMLSDVQAPLSNHFAGIDDRVEPRFVEFDGLPVLEGALATLACTIHDRVEAGDHTLFIGRVDDVAVADAAPLLYFRGRYGAFDPD